MTSTAPRRLQVLALLILLSTLAREHHPPLVIAIIPDGDQFGDPPSALVPHEMILAVCRDAGLDCIDLHPTFAAVGGSDLFLAIMHPDPFGQEVVAAASVGGILAVLLLLACGSAGAPAERSERRPGGASQREPSSTSAVRTHRATGMLATI